MAFPLTSVLSSSEPWSDFSFWRDAQDRGRTPLPVRRSLLAMQLQSVESTLVRRRLVQYVLTLLVSVSFLGPAFETIDRWDHFLQGGGDIVLTILGFGILCGLVLTLVRTLLVLISAYAAALGISIDFGSQAQRLCFFVVSILFSAQSPPIALRI